MNFEIKFILEADDEPEVQDLCEALYEAFTRAQQSAFHTAPHIAKVKMIGRQVEADAG